MNYEKLSLKEWCDLCHSIAKEKGFWDKERNIGEALMLIVTELAEAMEAHRYRGRGGICHSECQGSCRTISSAVAQPWRRDDR